MAVFQELGENARRVMRDMSVTQRLAIMMTGLTVALALGMVVFIGSVSEDVSTVPLPLTISPTEWAEVESLLLESGIESTYDVQKGVVTVDSKDRYDAWVLLAQNDMFDEDSHLGFEKALADIDYTITESNRQSIMLVARQNELAKMIATMKQVESAKVMFDGGDRNRIGPPIKPRASIMIKTALGKKLDQAVAETIISLVSASLSGLDKTNVTVTDQHGAHYYTRSTDDSGFMAAERLAQQRMLQEHYKQIVEDIARAFYPGIEAFGFVTVVLDLDTKREKTTEVLEGVAIRKQTSKEESESTSKPSAEVGTVPNTVRSANVSGGGGEHQKFTRKTGDTTYKPGEKITETIKTTGEIKDMSVSVMMHVPAKVELDPATNKPKLDADGKPVRIPAPLLSAEEVTTLQRAIAEGIGHPKFSDIVVKQVEWSPPFEAEDEVKLSAVLLAMVRENLTGIILGGITLMTLLMIYAQVRRVIPAEEMAMETPEAEEAIPSLFEGIGEDDRANIAFAQMRTKIGEIVDEDPKKAASLVKRWITAD
ncbi:MAG: hypothetical protein JXA52_07560 [Planctomycetes bacterium]|nr:hypothetical protein [Planctomycetota bacterium]